jgi:hypothetical protein
MNPAANPTLDESAQAELAAARQALRAPGSLVVRAADFLGRSLAGASHRLLDRFGGMPHRPDNALLTDIANTALSRAYDMVILGHALPGPPARASGPLVAVSGFAWGFAGFAGFLPDATFTTLMILRDITRIAREHGEDLATEPARAACLEVFALRAGDEAGYLSSRLLLEGAAARGLLARLAASWGAVLGEKFAAQALPVAGALAGAALNTAFLDQYRRLAKAHFAIRRLRRVYGDAAVEAVPFLEDARFLEDA